MRTLEEKIRFVCSIYLERVEKEAKNRKDDPFWKGYGEGQKNVANHILDVLNEYGK